MREKVESVLRKMSPNLGTGEVQLMDITDGVVTIRYYEVSLMEMQSKGMVTKETVIEIVEDALKKEIPEVKEVVIGQMVKRLK